MNWNGPDFNNVAGALAMQAQRQGPAVAIHYPTGLRRGRIEYQSCSYTELDELSDAYARGLHELGIGRGTRVALMVPPGLEFFALFFALFKAGVVPVLIDPGIGLKPLKHCLAEAAPEAFIGVTRAQVARAVLRWAPRSIRKLVTVGPRLGWGGVSLRQLGSMGQRSSGPMLEQTQAGEMAAILFTSGSTGIPKGVVYRHRHFTAQVEMLQRAFGIEAGEVDLPTFPPFALFDPALGMTTVIPWMDPTRPAKADPALLVQSIERFGVTNMFGSPALLRVLGKHAAKHKLRLDSVRRVISAGAAVPIPVVRDMQQALPDSARVFTPYGATECLPVAVISGHELDEEMEAHTLAGDGICVGRPVDPNRVAVIAIREEAIDLLTQDLQMPAGVCGEIAVQGPTTTDAYWQRERQTRLAKLTGSDGKVWHRMGDIGYLDQHGRLWYCGRKSQRVELDNDVLFPDQVEAYFNQHPEVFRTALVGVGSGAGRKAVLCIETRQEIDAHRRERIQTDLLQLAGGHSRFKVIENVLFHPGFPVDIRHNAKIGREQLAKWAAKKLGEQS
ncbi:MAG: AMP-binding protein [Gammaproteobacteria bacterium]|nr:AMP-binding protein [Gammaproteobacteria bacterium]